MTGKKEKKRKLSTRLLFGTQDFINIHRQKCFTQKNTQIVEATSPSGDSITYSGIFINLF